MSRVNRQAGAYIHGNAVRQMDVRRQLEEAPRRELHSVTRMNRDKAKHMSIGYVAFLSLALFVAGFVLIQYIQLQASITTKTEFITSQEKILNNMKVDNDEELSRINSRIDLEEIKRVAIGELGMVYPKEGQIITYEKVEYDYVRKLSDSN